MLSIDPLVVVPGEEEGPIVNREVAAAVLVNNCPDVDVFRSYLFAGSAVVEDDDPAAILFQPLFTPVEHPIEDHMSEVDASAGDHFGGNRPRPCAIGALSARMCQLLAHPLIGCTDPAA